MVLAFVTPVRLFAVVTKRILHHLAQRAGVTDMGKADLQMVTSANNECPQVAYSVEKRPVAQLPRIRTATCLAGVRLETAVQFRVMSRTDAVLVHSGQYRHLRSGGSREFGELS